MKFYLKYTIVSLVTLTTLLCKSQVNDTATFNVDTTLFSSKLLGWTMKIPQKWTVLPRANLQAQANNGLKLLAMENNKAAKKQITETVYLLSLKKSNRKMFSALVAPYDSTKMKYNQIVSATKELIYNSLLKQGIKTDSTWSKEIIDHKEFRVFKMTAYNKENQPIVNQVYYNCLIKNSLFTAIILYDTDESRDSLLNSWRSSKFE